LSGGSAFAELSDFPDRAQDRQNREIQDETGNVIQRGTNGTAEP